MPLQSVVATVLRLFAVQWFVEGIVSLLAAIPLSSTNGPSAFSLPAGYLIMMLVAWFAAPPVARLVTGSDNPTVSIAGLSRDDLYSFAFVFLGLTYVLSSTGILLHRIYLVQMHPMPRSAMPPVAADSLINPAVSLVVGAIVLVGAQRWARKLIRYEQARRES